MAEVARARNRLATPGRDSLLLLAQVPSALVLLYHHIDGFLSVIEVELIVFSLLLLRILLLVVVVERVLKIVTVDVPSAEFIHRIWSSGARARLAEPGALGTTQDLLLQLHLLSVLFLPIVHLVSLEERI